MTRALSLRREALADLTPAELGGVAGGGYPTPGGSSWGVTECLAAGTVDHVLTVPSRLLTCYSCVAP